MKKFTDFISALAVALIVFMVAYGIGEVYIDSLRDTGETVLARDVLGVKAAPYILAIFAFFITLKASE